MPQHSPLRSSLFNGDRRTESFDPIHVWLPELLEKLPGMSRERLDVFSLSLGVDGVKRQGTLSRPRQPGNHRERVARYDDIDVLQVVLAGTHDADTGF